MDRSDDEVSRPEESSRSSNADASMPLAGQWMAREAYRVKAPSAENAAEAERIRRADEAALAALREQKNLRRVSSCGQIGISDSGPANMREANNSFLDRLERRFKPATIAHNRREQEKQKREAEKQQQEQEKKQREAEWFKREAKRLARVHQINQEQRGRWQTWDDQQGSASSNSTTVVGSSGRSSSSCIASGSAQHSTNSTMSQSISQIQDRENLHATPASSAPAPQVCLICENHKSDMAFFDSDWQMCASCMSDSQSLAAANDCRFSPQAGSATQSAPVIALSLITSWPCPVCTFVNDINELRCSMCENSRPPPLRLPVPTSAAEPLCAGVSPVIGSANSRPGCNVVSVGHQSSPHPPPLPVFTSAAEPPSAGVAPGVRFASSEAGCSIGSVGHQSSPRKSLLAWLQQNRLEDYHSSLVEHGYDDLRDFVDMEQSELDELLMNVSMKTGHQARFRKAVARSFDGGNNHSSVSHNQRECAVCLIGPASNVDVALTPCGHVFCAQHAADASDRKQCPVCRSTVASTQRVFI